jgi:hypothetical protein
MPPQTRATARAATSDMGQSMTTLRAYYSRVLAEARGSQRALRERAQTVYLGIVKSSRMPYGIDKRMSARRQRKAILRMAAGYEMAELGAKAAIGMLNADFGTPGTQQAIRKTGFDMTK